MGFKKMKKIILIVILVTIVGITFSFPYIKEHYSKSIAEYVKEQKKIGIGSIIAKDFLISDRSGNEVSLREVFPDGLVLMVYDRSCPACRKAVAYMEVKLEKSEEDNLRPFAALEFSKKMDSELMALEFVKAFTTKIDQDETVFWGKASPQFFLIDAEGTIRDKEIGWNEVILELLLAADLQK